MSLFGFSLKGASSLQEFSLKLVCKLCGHGWKPCDGSNFWSLNKHKLPAEICSQKQTHLTTKCKSTGSKPWMAPSIKRESWSLVICKNNDTLMLPVELHPTSGVPRKLMGKWCKFRDTKASVLQHRHLGPHRRAHPHCESSRWSWCTSSVDMAGCHVVQATFDLWTNTNCQQKVCSWNEAHLTAKCKSTVGALWPPQAKSRWTGSCRILPWKQQQGRMDCFMKTSFVSSHERRKGWTSFQNCFLGWYAATHAVQYPQCCSVTILWNHERAYLRTACKV